MSSTISIIQIIIAIALIVLILLQQRGDSGGAGFLGGGGGTGGFYQQRRGLERLFFYLTIILSVIFAGLALTSLFYHEAPVTPGADVPASSTQATGNLGATATSPEITILPPSATSTK